MTAPASVWSCPFPPTAALDFDPLLKQMLDEAPIARIRLPHGEGEAWLVTRYEDVRTVVTDPRFSRAAGIGRDLPRMTPDAIGQAESINLMDPPAHTRLRRLLDQGFGSAYLERTRPTIQRIVDVLLDEMAEHGSPADLVQHLAARLPLWAICELLAIPEEDRPQLRRCAVAMMATVAPDREAATQSQAELRAYFTELTARRRRAPGKDLLSMLAMARDGEDALDDHELAAMGMVLLVTGHDTSSYQISNIVYTLLTHPEQLAALRARPEMLPRSIEELLRYIPYRRGVGGIPRVATEDVEVGGVMIRAGEPVHVSYLTANRDGSVFERPDELDLDREARAHMAFGWGAHHCVGAELARMELQVAIGTLLDRFPGLRLAASPGQLQWESGSLWRYPHVLPVAW
ncbi:cytochrome P450 [Streptomyces sp. 8N706]|uniref:cytochrome P450 n=1 Tax=Streptomyces sp. 8N706 TaxID=3457416 RepID=UPI003FD17D28